MIIVNKISEDTFESLLILFLIRAERHKLLECGHKRFLLFVYQFYSLNWNFKWKIKVDKICFKIINVEECQGIIDCIVLRPKMNVQIDMNRLSVIQSTTLWQGKISLIWF